MLQSDCCPQISTYNQTVCKQVQHLRLFLSDQTRWNGTWNSTCNARCGLITVDPTFAFSALSVASHPRSADLNKHAGYDMTSTVTLFVQ